MNELEKKICALNLTKGEKKIADYLLEHITSIGFASVKEVAEACGVSDTSIIRFLRVLGYSGYSDFKKDLNEKLIQQYNANLSPMQKFSLNKKNIRKESVVNDVFLQAIDNLNKGSASLNDDLLDKIADCLIQSKHKYIAAFRGTTCCAHYFWRKAIYFMPGLVLCDKAESETIEKLMDIGPEDCLMIFSFPRYTEITFSVCELAKNRGAKVIIVTDSVTSPLSSYADYLVPVKVDGISYTNSYVVPICLAEALAIIISQKLETEANTRLEELEKYIYSSKLY